jgi:deoxyribodipyrimidine photo-lyase
MGMTLFWHRRDLRIKDNAGLYKALKTEANVQPIFIFDTTILKELPSNDQRVIFIHQAVDQLKNEYNELGSDLLVYSGDPKVLIPQIALSLNASNVIANRDYEPYAKERDSFLFDALKGHSIAFSGVKDHVIFEKNEIVKNDGLPYTIFTPYMRKWKEKCNPFYFNSYPSENYTQHLNQTTIISKLISLKELGFEQEPTCPFPAQTFNTALVQSYHETRDFPAIDGTSKLSIHLRFGTCSIREIVRFAQATNAVFLNELIWRDFYQMIMVHFPHSVHQSFRKEYDRIQWEFNDHQFEAWKSGNTGYPLVDAGMRELNATGHMHNRVRMVVASFLTKHLLHDWRLGERYFALKLLDFELASNIGGWQWAAGSGCDAAPYFRVFNPTSQQQKFDPQFAYIKKWVPEFGTTNYPKPIVDHKWARERVLERYKSALKPI